MKNVMAHKNVKRTAIVDINGVKFGLFGIGLTRDPKDSKKYPRFGDSYDAARAAIKELRDKKVDVVVALTHLDRQDDEMLHPLALGIRPRSADRRARHEKMTIEDASGDRARLQGGLRCEDRVANRGSHSAEGKRAKIKGRRAARRHEAGNCSPTRRSTSSRRNGRRRPKRSSAPIAQAGEQGAERRQNACSKPAGSTQFHIELEEADNRDSETDFGQWIAERRAQGDEGGRRDRQCRNPGTEHQSRSGQQTALPAGRRHLPLSTTSSRCARLSERLSAPPFVTASAEPGTGAWPHVVRREGRRGFFQTPRRSLKKWKGTINCKSAMERPLDCGGRNANPHGRERSLSAVRRRRVSVDGG